MSMVVAHSEVPVKRESRERALELMEEMAITSRAEDGVIDYRVTVDIEDPTVLRIIEQYEDREAFEAHESSDHLETFQTEIAPYLAGEAELHQFVVASERTTAGP